MQIQKIDRASLATLQTELLKRDPNSYSQYTAAVKEIVEDVKNRRDAALFAYTAKFDHAFLSADSVRITEQEKEEAMRAVGPELIRVMKRSMENIRAYHERQLQQSWFTTREDGVLLGQKVMPLDSVGVYVPGGKAAYPSTVLMNIVPARVAGVRKIVMVTPPGRDGKVNPVTLAAAQLAGVTEAYKVGGAQAIAALAYGTETVPCVDKIVGPGNAYVAEAKKQVYGKVSIDMIAGPSEILIVADGKSNAKYVAADLLSQAEHDKNASAVLVTDSLPLAYAVREEIEKQLTQLEREEIARASVDNNGKIIVTKSLKEAIDVANEIAPEHLELCVDDPFTWLESVKNAGSVFLGRNCPEALGDYFAGPNHTLPTSGTARFSSPLGVDDFVKKTQFLYYGKEALAEVAADVAYFAKKEGLTGHARSAIVRTEEE